MVRDGAIIGIGDGAWVSAVTDALEDAVTPIRATVVPLAGGYWSTSPDRDPFRRVADALGAQPHGLMAPGLLDDAQTKQALESHAGVRAVIDLWGRIDVALFGIGGPSWGVASLGPDVPHELTDGSAVGEILIAPFDINGTFLCPALRERVLAFDARALHDVPVAIGVAAGGGHGGRGLACAVSRRVSARWGRSSVRFVRERSRRSSPMSRRPGPWSRSTTRVADDDAGGRGPGRRSRDDRGQGRAWRTRR